MALNADLIHAKVNWSKKTIISILNVSGNSCGELKHNNLSWSLGGRE